MVMWKCQLRRKVAGVSCTRETNIGLGFDDTMSSHSGGYNSRATAHDNVEMLVAKKRRWG